ncbi:MAG: hypothetical protein KH354_02825 [Clostridiales bacterium]|nr:hypothetical protein [Clostridiales bacterium]
MTKEESEQLSAELAAFIAEEAPYIEYSDQDISAYSQAHPGTDAELCCVLERFCTAFGLQKRADPAYLCALYHSARRFYPAEFYADPYLKNVRVPEAKIGSFVLANASYERGELFQYDMPDLAAKTVVPKLGFFTGKVQFPGIYEGNIPWMSVCPSEIFSMREPIAKAHGRVLVLGLGLGYYPFMILQKESVQSITIIERQPEIISLFCEHLLPQFGKKTDLHIIQADALEYLASVRNGQFDFCFADIWENQFDGAEAYLRIKRFEGRLPETEFAYWIEDSIRQFLSSLR